MNFSLMFIPNMSKTDDIYVHHCICIYFVLYVTFIISYINDALKFDEQGNKQKALQFYQKGMQNHHNELLHVCQS